MNTQSDICIIGGGIIGKTAALCFAHAGNTVTLLRPVSKAPTKLPSEAWDVRVYALNHVAQRILSRANVWNALDASRIAPVEAMDVSGDGERGTGHIAFDAYAARVGALAWIVEDSNLNRALDAALDFAPNVTLVSGRASQLKVDQTEATILLDNHDTLSAKLVIGADGAHSWVRGQCDIGFDYRAYEQRAIVTNFEVEKQHQGIAYQWFAAQRGIVALLPLPGQRVSLVWSAPDALADELLASSIDDVARQVSEFCGETLGRLTPLQPASLKSFPLAFLRPHAITASRVALIGDAAHQVHPLAGHGMNLGFSDIAALTQVIAEREAHRDCGDARVLSRYARARKEDILLMQLATDGLERLFSTEFEPVRAIRNAGLNFFNQLPFMKRRLIAHAIGKRP